MLPFLGARRKVLLEEIIAGTFAAVGCECKRHIIQSQLTESDGKDQSEKDSQKSWKLKLKACSGPRSEDFPNRVEKEKRIPPLKPARAEV